MSRHHSPHIITDGLVLYLDATNSKSYISGNTTWHDISKYNNNGTLSGATFSQDRGGGFIFNGNTDWINLGNDTSLQIGGNNISLCAWIKTSASQYQPILDDLGISDYTSWGMWLTPTGNIAWFGWDASSIAVNTGNITNVVAIMEDGIVKFYINSIKDVNEYTKSALIPTTDNKVIGARSDGVGYFFNGTIYNCSIYNRALTAQEIKQNFNALKGRFGL